MAKKTVCKTKSNHSDKCSVRMNPPKTKVMVVLNLAQIVIPQPYSVFDLCKICQRMQYN
jgi:hypothetical protein